MIIEVTPVLRTICFLLALCCATLALAGNVADPSWPRVTAPRLAALPAIDGRLGPGEWDAAAPLGCFLRLGGETIAPQQPQAWLGWREEGLLVAVRVPLPPGQKARAQATDFDGTVWADDSIELHMDRGHKQDKNYQFVINALGTEFDSYGGDAAYNAKWQTAAVNEPGQWTGEMLIPWAALQSVAPQAGQVDGFNLAVNASNLGGILTFAPLTGGLHQPAKFAHLVYSNGPAAGVVGDLRSGQDVRVQGVGAGSLQAALTVARLLSNGGTENVGSETRVLDAPGTTGLPLTLPLDQGFVTAGKYRVTLTATAGGAPLLVQRGLLDVGPPLALKVRAFLARQELDITATPQAVVFPAPQTELKLTVTAAGRTTLQEPGKLEANGQAHWVIPARKLPVGTFTLQVTVSNSTSGKRFTAERQLDRPLNPVWLGTREGLSDKVPAPWTPLVVQGEAVKPWGRSYRFAGSPLPTEIVTRGASVLAGPIRLTGTVDGKPLAWKPSPVRFTSRKPIAVALTGAQQAPGLKLTGQSTVEFDGMIRTDLQLTPAAGATVKDLTLEIPLKAEHARYLYHFPGRWGSVDNSGFVPKDGWTHAFKPCVWLGDEDRGLEWFCESPENWFPVGSPTALQIERGDKVVTLRCRLIQGERKLDQPLKYTFGFEATPCKQPEKTVWDYRITHHGNYGLENQPASVGGAITYDAAKYLKAEQGTFECWYRPAFPNSERGVPFAQRTATTNRHIFTVKWGNDIAGGSNCGLYWNEQVQGPVGWARREGEVLLNPAAPMDWEAGRWYHLALTWSDKVRIYVDGKLMTEVANTGFIPQPLAGAVIELGGQSPLAAIDEVRILKVARPPAANPGEYQPDADTLLLDHFDTYGKPGAKSPGEAPASISFGPGKFGQGVTWEPGQARKQLEYLASQGVRTICFHEHWSPYQSHPYATAENDPKLRRLIAGCHAQKVNLLLYMSRQFADNSPEWDLYADEFLQEPRLAPYRRAPEQADYIGCWNSAYQDFCLYYLGQTIQKYGNDGWYLDGPEWPMPCHNEKHGCGYVGPDGTRQTRYDIFGTREFMKRLYILTRQRQPEGQLNIHNSTVMVIPTLGFGTSSWGGEQIDAIKPPAKTLDFMPLDAFRTEFMGRQWGVPSEFLVYDGMPYYSRDMFAYTLLHGVLIRPTDVAGSGVAALWRMHDRFPFSSAKMHPYWSNAEYLKVGPDGVYATAWERPKEGLLIIVSNLNDDPREVALTVNLNRFGLRSVTVKDALTDEPVALDQGTAKFALDGWRYRYLRVTPK